MKKRIGLTAMMIFIANGLVHAQNHSYAAFNLGNVGALQFTDLGLNSNQPPAATTYTGVNVSVDWSYGTGDPYSIEAALRFVNNSLQGVTYFPDSFSNTGGADNASTTTLTWSGLFQTPYTSGNPLALGARQSYLAGGTTGNWANVVITLTNPPPPTPPPSTPVSDPSSNTFPVASNSQIVWVSLNYTGGPLVIDTLGTGPLDATDTEIGIYAANGALIASNDDISFPTNVMSQLTFAPGVLSPGTYYIAAGFYDVNFGTAFNVTSNGSTNLTSPLFINVNSAPVPEPVLLGIAAFGVLGLVRRRM